MMGQEFGLSSASSKEFFSEYRTYKKASKSKAKIDDKYRKSEASIMRKFLLIFFRKKAEKQKHESSKSRAETLIAQTNLGYLLDIKYKGFILKDENVLFSVKTGRVSSEAAYEINPVKVLKEIQQSFDSLEDLTLKFAEKFFGKMIKAKEDLLFIHSDY
jgi:hypothetical protein